MHVGESLQAWRGFSCNILNKDRGKTSKSAEGGSCKESSRWQSRHPRVQLQFHSVMVAQDGGSVNKGLEKNSDPALLAAVLKGAVQGGSSLIYLRLQQGRRYHGSLLTVHLRGRAEACHSHPWQTETQGSAKRLPDSHHHDSYRQSERGVEATCLPQQ